MPESSSLIRDTDGAKLFDATNKPGKVRTATPAGPKGTTVALNPATAPCPGILAEEIK